MGRTMMRPSSELNPRICPWFHPRPDFVGSIPADLQKKEQIMQIAEIFRNPGPALSFEFFPPRSEKGAEGLFVAVGG